MCGRTPPPAAGAGGGGGGMEPTRISFPPLGPRRVVSILTMAIWYSCLSFAPGKAATDTVLSPKPMTLPTTMQSAVATRWEMGDGAIITALAGVIEAVTLIHSKLAKPIHIARFIISA